MSDPTESDLDLHFQSQLYNMDDVYAQDLNETDVVISQSWLKIFKKAPKSDKYARNCLMLLMYSQLSELGHLDMPFTNLDNQNICLEKLVCDYKNDNDDDGSIDLPTTFTGSGFGAQSLSTTIDDFTEESNNSDDFDHFTQAKESDLDLTKMLSNEVVLSMPDHCDLNKAIASQTCLYTLKALKELKKWSIVDGNNRFLSTAFQYFKFVDPGFHTQFKQFDLQFEHCLQHIIKVECDRHAKNVRMIYDLYDQQYKVQRKELQAQEEQLRCDFLALALERENLNSRMELLKQQEELLYQEETAAQYNHSLLNLKDIQLANQPHNTQENSHNFLRACVKCNKHTSRPKNYENIDENLDKDSTK